MKTVGERLAAEFNLIYARNLPRRGSLDAWMLNAGVPADVVDITACAYSGARITVFDARNPRGQMFENAWFEPDGRSDQRAVLIPEGAQSVVNPPAWAQLADIVAFDWKQPNRWWRRLGALDVLGQAALMDARLGGTPLNLYRHPLNWLKAGRRGAVLIDRERNPAHMLHGIAEIVCEDETHQRWLANRLHQFALKDLPKVRVAGGAGNSGSSRPAAEGGSCASPKATAGRAGSRMPMTPEPARAA